MYTPEKFNIEDREAILRFIRQNPFGLLLSVGGGVIHDTHTPFIVAEDGKQLLGHLARANPQWASWGEGSVAKVVFSGPHAYVSPRYYESEFAVPTWNYTAVSVSGQIRIGILSSSTTFFPSSAPSLGSFSGWWASQRQ